MLTVLVPLTLLINGVGVDSLMRVSGSEYALAIRQGCQIGLDNWYISFTLLCGVKLLIQLLRYLHVRTNAKESVVFHLGGNFVVMPILFTVFFVYTQQMFENADPEVLSIMSPVDASRAVVKPNECLEADSLSKVLYGTFQMVSVVSYAIAIYYIVTTTMLFQGYCLIKAIANRRIALMRRRDMQEETGEVN